MFHALSTVLLDHQDSPSLFSFCLWQVTCWTTRQSVSILFLFMAGH